MRYIPSAKILVLLAVVATIVCLDQFTKQLILDGFQYGESRTLIPGFFNLTHVHNPGAAFGFLSQWDSKLRMPFFIFVPFAALMGIAAIFRRVGDSDLFLASALALIVGGAFGNLIDRVSFGYVVDFLDFYWGQSGIHFPAFNVADIAITVGVGVLLVDLYRKDRSGVSSKEESDA